MGLKNTWNKLVTFWNENMDRNHKKISMLAGVMMAFIIGAFFTMLATFVATGIGDLKTFGSDSLKAIGIFSVGLIFITFGNDKTNGNGETKTEEK